MKHHRTVAIVFALWSCAASAWAQKDAMVWLVTPDEMQLFQGAVGFDAPGVPRTRSMAPLPSIEVLQPSAPEQKLKTPFPISLKFTPADAPIVASTFKVLYGALHVDITSRVAKFVQPSRDGFSLDKAQIPPGRHRITLQVADEKQRVAERELRIEVE